MKALVPKVKLISVETSANKHRSFVGFSAALNRSHHYDNGDTIEFPTVMYNDGGHFKPAINRYSVKYILEV